MPAPVTIVQNPTAATRYYAYLPPHGRNLTAGQSVTVDGDLYALVQAKNKRLLAALANDETNNRVRIVSQPDVGPQGAGTCPVAGAGVVERGDAVVHQTTITIPATSVPTTDAGASGAYGALKVYDFPEGLITVHAAVAKLSFTKVGAGIGATAGLKYSLGTVAEAANDTLDSTQANIVPSTAATLAAGAATDVVGKMAAASGIVDGTATAVDAYLNLGIPDAGSTATDAVLVSGTVVLTWSFGGND